MPAATCPLPGCTYTTDDAEPVLAAAQLNLHALTYKHTSAAPTTRRSTDQSSEKTHLRRTGTRLSRNGTFSKGAPTYPTHK